MSPGAYLRWSICDRRDYPQLACAVFPQSFIGGKSSMAKDMCRGGAEPRTNPSGGEEPSGPSDVAVREEFLEEL